MSELSITQAVIIHDRGHGDICAIMDEIGLRPPALPQLGWVSVRSFTDFVTEWNPHNDDLADSVAEADVLLLQRELYEINTPTVDLAVRSCKGSLEEVIGRAQLFDAGGHKQLPMGAAA
jgi:hypothetical protein